MITKLSWDLTAVFTREQVLAVGKVAEFTGNIESMLKTDFGRSVTTVDWQEFRKVMTMFMSLRERDHIAVQALSNVVDDVNRGKIALSAGQVYKKETE